MEFDYDQYSPFEIGQAIRNKLGINNLGFLDTYALMHECHQSVNEQRIATWTFVNYALTTPGGKGLDLIAKSTGSFVDRLVVLFGGYKEIWTLIVLLIVPYLHG